MDKRTLPPPEQVAAMNPEPTVLMCRVGGEVAERFKAIANTHGLGHSAFLRRLVERYVEIYAPEHR